MKKVLSKAWQAWKRIARKIGKVQTIILLTILYFILFAPVGAMMRLFGWDPLETRFSRLQATSNWKPVKNGEPDLRSLRRMS